MTFPVITRDPVIEAEYAAAKAERALLSLDDISRWPDGLQERFTRRLDIVRKDCDVKFGEFFYCKLVSSWIEGAGVDEFTEQEEPEFWKLKASHKTWQNRYPGRMKVSDFDINVYTKLNDESIKLRGLWDLDDNGVQVRVDLYVHKGERGLRI